MLLEVEDPQLKGFLELPGTEHHLGTALAVAGWVYSSGSPIRALHIVLDGGPPQEISHGLTRRDVAVAYSDFAATSSGFDWQIPVAGVNGSRLLVEVFATLENGRRLRCFARTVQPIASRG